jgi:hypothetical protein
MAADISRTEPDARLAADRASDARNGGGGGVATSPCASLSG